MILQRWIMKLENNLIEKLQDVYQVAKRPLEVKWQYFKNDINLRITYSILNVVIPAIESYTKWYSAVSLYNAINFVQNPLENHPITRMRYGQCGQWYIIKWNTEYSDFVTIILILTLFLLHIHNFRRELILKSSWSWLPLNRNICSVTLWSHISEFQTNRKKVKQIISLDLVWYELKHSFLQNENSSTLLTSV